IGSRDLFLETARRAGIDAVGLADAILDTCVVSTCEPGKPHVRNAAAVTGAIERGVQACEAGTAAALVTAPIHKAVLTEAGFGFPGHTEFLAALTGRKQAVMMLASSDVDPPLRVVPFTIHIPLKEVFGALNAEAIAATGRIVLDGLARDFG